MFSAVSTHKVTV